MLRRKGPQGGPLKVLLSVRVRGRPGTRPRTDTASSPPAGSLGPLPDCAPVPTADVLPTQKRTPYLTLYPYSQASTQSPQKLSAPGRGGGIGAVPSGPRNICRRAQPAWALQEPGRTVSQQLGPSWRPSLAGTQCWPLVSVGKTLRWAPICPRHDTATIPQTGTYSGPALGACGPPHPNFCLR